MVEKRGGGMTENIAIYCLKAASVKVLGLLIITPSRL